MSGVRFVGKVIPRYDWSLFGGHAMPLLVKGQQGCRYRQYRFAGSGNSSAIHGRVGVPG